MRNTYAYDTDVVMDDGSPPIRTTVTNSGDAVKRYLREVRKRGGRLLVGLDTEWRVIRSGAHRMAVLQLCVGRRCLVFQIARADYVPGALRGFLADPGHIFAAVGVGNDVERLYDDCGLVVANPVDLPPAAAEVLGRPELRRAGLKALAREVMGVDVDKDKGVARSEWGRSLSPVQVRYACIDAFVSYEVGRLLREHAGAGDDGVAAGATMAPFVGFELP
ncbi:uncharacterized protein LOC120710523 [Panicum virgatum]|uniref:3'-5' exonuclease domain-containing protein n=1 Tax=Panicum virgatum TaxID=38727 RepID=A0A8T0SHS0_PANVG|nr:uncharacterized protein LOC120710523 [Panicum virgatum]KAG2596483.1 hypothetical protein PVAP13_5KG164800 [Panicum virgatum]